jgi:hypothetical protein
MALAASRFAPDSLLEGEGFEPSVPRQTRRQAQIAAVRVTTRLGPGEP